MTARNTKDYLAEIRDLTTDPPDARVVIELIEQVLNRWEDAEADAALEQLARTGALDDLPILDKGTSDPARVQSEDVSPTIGSATNLLGQPDASAPTGWQAIATAPRDGTNVLLTDGRTASQGGWLSQTDQGADYEGQSGAPSAGWWSVDSIEHPTHWQPLPSPPDGSSPGGERQTNDDR